MTLLFQLDGLRRGPSASPVAPAWVLIRDGRTEHAGAQPPPDLPPGCPTLRGGWAVEPLADAHVHLHLPGEFSTRARRAVASLSREAALARICGLLEEYRRRGIAAVRDGGGPSGLALEAAAITNRQPGRYARLLPAGRPLRRNGCYGAFLGEGIDSVADGLRLLEWNRAAGATHAKVLATGANSLETTGGGAERQFSRAELEVLVRGARDLGLGAMVHANGPLADVVSAKPDTIEHGFWVGAGELRAMADQGIGWVPTLGAWAELRGHPDLTPRHRAVVVATDRRHRREVAEGAALGVPVAAGSDAGTPGVAHGEGLLRELQRLARAGPSAPWALATASWHARTACEQEAGRALGGLAVGGPAGLLWVSRDPGVDLATLRCPRGVYIGGTWSPAPAVPQTQDEVATSKRWTSKGEMESQ